VLGYPSSLPHRSRQALASKTKPLTRGVAGEPFLRPEFNSFLFLLRRDTPVATGWVCHLSTDWWLGRWIYRSVHRFGETSPFRLTAEGLTDPILEGFGVQTRHHEHFLGAGAASGH